MKIINILIQNFTTFLIFFVITLEIQAIGNEKKSVKNIFVEFNINKNIPSRKLALEISYKTAVRRYIEWVTLLEEESIISLLEKINPNLLISGYSIENEKFTKKRYSASITVNLDLKKIKNYLNVNNVPYFLDQGPRVLIIPVVKFNDRTILWDDPNPWFNAWMERPLDSNLTNLLLPLGEVEDLITLSAKDADDLTDYKIRNIAAKYNADEVLILKLSIEKENDFYNLNLLAFEGLKGKPLFLDDLSYKKEISFEKTVLNLANAFTKRYDDIWVRENIERLQLETITQVRLKYNSFADWIKIKNSLLDSNQLSFLKVLKISNSDATIMIKFLSKEKLIDDLEEKDININTQGEIWIISIIS